MNILQVRKILSVVAICSWLGFIGVSSQGSWFDLFLLGLVLIVPMAFVLSVFLGYCVHWLRPTIDRWSNIWISFAIIPFTLSILTYIKNYKPTYRFEINADYAGTVVLLEKAQGTNDLLVNADGIGYLMHANNRGSVVEIYHGDTYISDQFTGPNYINEYSIWKNDSSIQEWCTYNCFVVDEQSRIRPCDDPDSVFLAKMRMGALDSTKLNWYRYDHKNETYLK